jgi:hypothetical protein
MKTVDEKMLYDAGRPNSSEAGAEARPAPPPDDRSARSPSHDESTSLNRKLSLSMAGPSDIPAPEPDLQPTPVGHVRADLDKQLEKAVSVLASRYDTDLPRSIVLEFALQRALVEVREQGDESPLVTWLDSVLPRH